MKRVLTAWAVTFTTMLLAGCLGGGGGGGGGDSAPASPTTQTQSSTVQLAGVPASGYALPSAFEASRFLHQASFGANTADIDKVQRFGYSAWLEEQFNMSRLSHVAYMDYLRGVGVTLDDNRVINSFWWQALNGQDQLRQRVAFALSQIFVISLQDATVSEYKRGVASYLEMLGRNSFGNYRTLLEDVTRHPMMGIYLSHLRNQKEDPARNRIPDQNYAREVLQLFSIGLYELNPDGTKVLASGQPVDSYDSDDIVGLSRVFTGFSWAGPDKQNGRFFGNSTPAPDPDRDIKPMQGYPAFHSTLEKRFLTAVIPAQGTANPDESLRIALDTLANHPNVGPFLGRQLIQRLVTSNPSPAYVGRVAQAFNTGRFTSGQYSVGTGQRGDLKATVAAVLLDAEARTINNVVDPNWGRVREPILRVGAWMRAFNARSTSTNYLLGATDDPASSLGQSAMRSPSVFNFYRPGYVPPNTGIATANLVAPELQIMHETSVVGYSNFMRSAVQSGVGSGNPRDIQPDYTAELALADNPDALINRVDLLLTYGTMSTATKNEMRGAITSIAMPTTNQTSARQNRVWTAVYFAVTAPDFLVMK